MGRLLFLFAMLAMWSCGKSAGDIDVLDESRGNPSIAEGVYMGSIEYEGELYWSQIDFSDGTYQEYSSGGVWFQKPPDCLTQGSWSFDRGSVHFSGKAKPVGRPVPCAPVLELTGAYYYHTFPDSISFWKYANGEKVLYSLKKMNLD